MSALSRIARSRRDRGVPILDLTAASSLRTEPLGSLGARQAIAEDWLALGVSISPDDVVLTASRSEAYSVLFAMLCDAEDEMLVPAPGSRDIETIASMRDVRLLDYSLSFEDGRWALDPASIYDAITEHTRGIVIGNPHCPTGARLDRDAAEALAALGLPVISDESFAHVLLEGHGVSMLDSRGESLCFALGARDESTAWIGVSGPPDLVAQAKARLEFLSEECLSENTLFQGGAIDGWVSASRIRDEVRGRCARNLAILRELARGTSIDVPKVSAGVWACLWVAGERSDEELARALLETDGVLVHPGRAFHFPSRSSWLIVSLLTPERVFDAGIRALLRRIA